jgi:acetoin utilization protein AcuB
MRIRDIMTTPVETIAPTTSADDAWARMEQEKIHHLVVVEGKRVVGVLSERDLGGAKLGPKHRAGKAVAELMSKAPVTTKPDATLRAAANLLRGYGIGCVPVVDGERLVGILTITDVLDLVGRGAERPVEKAKRWTLRHRGPRAQKTRRWP